jgi:hypothetical protein
MLDPDRKTVFKQDLEKDPDPYQMESLIQINVIFM